MSMNEAARGVVGTGIGNMPPVVGAKAVSSPHGRYFAREGVPPLSHAFEGKIAVHPGLGGGKVPSEEMGAHLDALLDQERRGKSVAYIHVPFCQTHCLYCGFYSTLYHAEDSRAYADALIAELELWRGRKAMESGPVHALYMGGGTPTALDGEDIRRILKAARAALPLANDCEVTVEGRLSNLTPARWKPALKAGPTVFPWAFRASIRTSAAPWAASAPAKT